VNDLQHAYRLRPIELSIDFSRYVYLDALHCAIASLIECQYRGATDGSRDYTRQIAALERIYIAVKWSELCRVDQTGNGGAA